MMSLTTLNFQFVNKLFLLFFLYLLSTSSTALAESSLSSEVGSKFVFYNDQLSPEVNPALLQTKLTSTYENKLLDQLKVKINLAYIADPLNRSSEEKDNFDFPEFNLKLKANDFIIKLGLDIFNWGVTDGYNPIDILNTKNYFDPLHSQKLGTGAVSINYASEKFDLDVIYIPQARDPILPGTSSRWLPRDIYVTQNPNQEARFILPSDLHYNNYEYLAPADSALTSNIGLRTQLHFEQLELALYGYDGVAPMPLITPIASGTLIQASPVYIFRPDYISLRLQSYRQHTTGFSFIKTFSDEQQWQLKGLTTWTQPFRLNSNQANWSHESVLAIEKPWNTIADGSLITFFQYSFIRKPTSSGNDLGSLSRFFESNVMIGGNFLWRDSDSYTFFYSYDLIKYSQLAELNYEKKLTDTQKINFGISYIEGANDSPIGLYSKNKNLRFGISQIF